MRTGKVKGQSLYLGAPMLTVCGVKNREETKFGENLFPERYGQI